MPDAHGRFTMEDGLGFASVIQGFQSELRDKQRHAAVMEEHEFKMAELRRQKDENAKLRELEDKYTVLLNQGKDLPEPVDAVESAAFAKASESWANTAQGKQKIGAARNSVLLDVYNNKVRPNAMKARERVSAGDMKGARPFIEAASKETPIPYRHVWDEGSGFYIEKFRSDATGEWEDNRHVTEEEAVQALNQIISGDQVTGAGRYENPIFMKLGQMASEATVQSNREKWQDKDKWTNMKDSKGNSFQIVPANSPLDYESPTMYMLYDKDGKRVFNRPKRFKDKYSSTPVVSLHEGNFSMHELRSLGLAQEDLKRAKDVADIDHTRAQTGKVYADTDKSRAETVKTYADTDKSVASTQKTQAETEQLQAKTAGLPAEQAREKLGDMRKALGDALKPFHQKGITMINSETGELTNEGNNAFNDAATFLENYRAGKWKPQNEADRVKLQSAQQAVGIYQEILKSGQSHVPSETPEQRKQVDELKQLIKQYGKDGAMRILNRRAEIRTRSLPSGIRDNGYGG
ncbi:hypothetical protein [Maridesulfovibrio sp. FT414]|uniref:hypothetical protein n=1 Tax=Maridesulfovibrio sp. FT414 TaxID=2979469 RepID=UPI003D8051D1